MKRFFVLVLSTLFLSFLVSFSLCGQEIHWLTDYQKAVDFAREKQKPLLLYFTGSDWCGWSMKLKKEVLDTTDFIEEVSNQFVFVEVDFPLYKSLSPEAIEQNNVLKDQNQINNFPTIVVLDSKQRIISKFGYMPGSGKSYAQALLKQVEQDRELTEVMTDFKPQLLSSDQLEKYYKRAMQFRRDKEAAFLLEAGLKSTDNLYFLTEKYRLYVDNGQGKKEEAVELREKLLGIDPDNQKNMQFFIALTDFQILSDHPTPSDDLTQVVAPLVEYITHFGKQDKDNAWRLEMIIAQFYYDYEEHERALSHAQLAYEEAPLPMKAEIKRSMDYIREHPSL